jgi:LysM repeat protein
LFFLYPRETGIIEDRKYDKEDEAMSNKSSKTIYLKTARKKTKAARLKKIILLIAALLGVVIGLLIGLLPNAYEVSIKGEVIGSMRKREFIDKAAETVKAQLENQYNTKVELKDVYEIKKVRAKNKDIITTSYLTSVMRKNMDFLLEVYALKVDGQQVGVVAYEEVIEQLQTELSKVYFGEELAVSFVNDVTLERVFAKEEEIISLQKLVEISTQTSKKQIEYEVVQGDTLSGIANKLGITMTRLLAANEGMSETTIIRIGMLLKAEVDVPLIMLQKIEGEQQ